MFTHILLSFYDQPARTGSFQIEFSFAFLKNRVIHVPVVPFILFYLLECCLDVVTPCGRLGKFGVHEEFADLELFGAG